MQRRPLFWFLVSLLCLAGAVYFWRLGDRWQAEKKSRAAVAPEMKQAVASSVAQPVAQALPSILLLSHPADSNATQQASAAAIKARLAYRLSNTGKSLGQLVGNDRAILLANALIDTEQPMNLKIPDALRAPEQNGSYVVQARGAPDDAFRARLREAGATIVSYIPNNAYLVRMGEAGAQQLAGDGQTQAVLPYEPYYKLETGLLKLAVEGQALPAETVLKVTLFPDATGAAETLKKMGMTVLSQGERSPFGQVMTVQPGPEQLAALTRLPMVQLVGRAHARVAANDLFRTRLGITLNGATTTNYLGLSGTNVLVTLNDSGVDMTHPDLTGRIFGDTALSLVDTNGHGTHVGGTIAGSGLKSTTVTNVVGSSSNANFRGMAPLAKLYSLPLDNHSDNDLQEQGARTNSLISNNSWNYIAAAEYNIEAANYDAAVRDALPQVSGSQPVLFVFSAGNDGNGDDDLGTGGDAQSILSPATAKNVITVGAIEQERSITNELAVNGVTNQPFLAVTHDQGLVPGFSSRGNVGIGIEGDGGRFKPDVVAPGTFVVSDRSSQWDTNAYYNPTNFQFNTFINQTVETNSLTPYSIFIPDDAVGLTITVVATDHSPDPFPPMPIYVRYADNPTVTTFDFRGTNQVSAPQNFALNTGTTLFYSVGNGTNITVSYDLVTELIRTNDHPELQLLKTNLNAKLAPYYRFESGTSMAAAGVSGMLALMQEFFEQRMHVTNSPALMKALLINGARPLGAPYDLNVNPLVNYQGWGLPQIANSIPGALTNATSLDPLAGAAMRFFDQSPTNALATGDSQTRKLTLARGGVFLPLRITLVWTDPPGNPAASLKLVNDLDLIVTNLDTGDVYFGNNIPAGESTQPWDTNTPPPLDMVNNVENVFLDNPRGTNFSITVQARRVNVNAITANTNGIVQDFALVISSGDAGELTNAFTLAAPSATVSNNVNVVSIATNGVPIFNQRVGANSQYTGTSGVTNQWHFYVYTNTTLFTNVAFITFLPPNLGVPRMGTRQTDPNNATRTEADIDLYVSSNRRLTNLNSAVLVAADVSRTRTGTEKVLYSNSVPGQIYYVGVKSEDQEGAEYGFVAVANKLPFGLRDANGNIHLTVLGDFPVNIPDGSPALPGQATILALTTEPDAIRRIIVTNQVTHENYGDTIGTLSHGSKFAVLNNHTFLDNGLTNETLIYDDSGEGDAIGSPIASRKSDGPGSLRTFVGDKAVNGVWMLSMVDDSLTQTGRVDQLDVLIEPESATNGVTVTIRGRAFFFDFIDVPPEATNLTVSIAISATTPNPVELFLRRDDFPTLNTFDKMALINPPGGSLSITKFDSPPLNAGRYFIAVYNPNLTPVTVTIFKSVALDLNPLQPFRFLSRGGETLLDDAVTYSTNTVSIDSRVVRAEVGVRIDHPRISDLVLTLISPQGTRTLLAENRGGLSTNGYGAGVDITNSFPVTSSGGAAANTNVLATGGNVGTLLISYDFFTIPDTIHVYYDGVKIFDSGSISGSGNFAIDYGPGVATSVVVIMNEGGNPNTTEWTYTVTGINRAINYATFSEDTNKALVPIKFAIPPFGGTNVAGGSAPLSDFETSAPGDYLAVTGVDGWTVLSNKVTVLSDPTQARTGSNYLGLRNGSISRTLPTIAGNKYVLQFADRRSGPLDPIHWWPGDGTTTDIVGAQNGALVNGASYIAGEVGQAFNFNINNDQYVKVPASASLNIGAGNGFTIDCWIYPSDVTSQAPLVEWNSNNGIPGIGAHFWISTAALGGGVGSLWANLVDTTGVSHALSSAPGFVQPNTWSHVALTYDKISGTAKLYYDGTVVATTNFSTSFSPQTAFDLYFGKRIGGISSVSFPGRIDEIGFYDKVLTVAQIKDIFDAGSLGRCGTLTPPSICPPVQANVLVGGTQVHTITGVTNWVIDSIPFTAIANGTPFEIDFTNCPSGMLLDTFIFTQPGQNSFYLPEESLDKVIGERSLGDWKLEIVDNRAGPINAITTLVSWELSLTLDTTVPSSLPLTHAVPQTNQVVNANDIRYFAVDVPPWAQFATNLLFNVTGGQVNLLFNQNGQPSGGGAGDFTIIPTGTGGIGTLTTNGPTPLLVPGARYYLGVQNQGATPVTFSIEVDFDITSLTNGVPLTNSLPANGIQRYYQYDVSPSGIAVAFEILNPSGNVDLVARKGVPLPDQLSFDYFSGNPGTNNEAIVVFTNSVPVVLSPGRWYLGVFNNDVNAVNYTIRATETGPPLIINLTNGVPFNFTATPGVALTNFFSFQIDQTNPAALFELYNLSGNVDLTLQRARLPFAAPYFDQSVRPGTSIEQIVIRTNLLGTNINDLWFLGVPNNESSNVTYTIRATVSTNGILMSVLPITVTVTRPPPGATNGPTLTWTTVPGEKYVIQTSTNLLSAVWTPIVTNTASGSTTIFVDPTPIAGIPLLFYRIVQVP
ncbi:MAG: Peptidase and in kexin sedolisin [Pedosphaera sp.]|nr:Peptidase and in kexin sedolisin [Pedosphaera sp.]